MRDFKNNPEIVRNILKDADGGTNNQNIQLSLVICVWNTSHLLKRSIEMYCKQDLPTDKWELIVVDDNSEDDVMSAIKFAEGKINLRYIKLQHRFGMRGNTVAFNTGFAWSRGNILAESTPETMFTPDGVRTLLDTHFIPGNERVFVAMKTFNLVHWMQLKIDTVDWRADIMNISALPGWSEPYVQNNVKNENFGTHQTCSIRKELFYQIFPLGFPLYGDYGSEDPHYLGRRLANNVRGVTIMTPMLIHQWHPSWHYWGVKGKAPMLNKYGHSLSNYLGDETGEVPPNGSAQIWDTDKVDGRETYGDKEREQWGKVVAPEGTWDDIVRATGCNIASL